MGKKKKFKISLVKKNTKRSVKIISLLIMTGVILFGIILGFLSLGDKHVYKSSAAMKYGAIPCDNTEWYLYGECASEQVRKVFGGNSALWRQEKTVNYNKAKIISTVAPTSHKAVSKSRFIPTSENSVLSPSLFTKEDEESRYPAHYWGSRGIATSGIQLENGGKIWGTDWWKPLLHEDMIYNMPNYQPPDYKMSRSLGNWWKVVNHFNLNHKDNARYQPANGLTFCNIALGDLTRAFGVWIPHWYEGKELVANKIYDQLLSKRKFWSKEKDEWVQISQKKSIEYANKGIPVVIAIKNLEGKSGHVGIVAPSQDGVLYVAQAGSINGIVPWDWNKYKAPTYSTPLFWINTADY